jgi:hypothetical protein
MTRKAPTNIPPPSSAPGDESTLLTGDRRRYTRVKLALSGRYLTPDGSEYPCSTVDVSPGGVRLKGPRVCAPGSHVIVYIRDLGRLEGVVVRTVSDGFALALDCTPRKTERLLSRIEWLLDRNAGGAERRASPRFEPDGPFVVLISEDGSHRVVELTDISSNGFAFLTEQLVKIGDRLELGTQRARISRLFPGGAAAIFE